MTASATETPPTFTQYQLILSSNLIHHLNLIHPKMVDTYCERQKLVLNAFCDTQSTVKIDDVDSEGLVLESVQIFFGTFAEFCIPVKGKMMAHNLMVAYSRQLSINTYGTHDSRFVLLLDILPAQVVHRADVMFHWIASKYSHELSLNKTH